MTTTRRSLILALFICLTGTAFAQPIVNHFDCRAISVHLANKLKGKPELDQLAYLTSPRRGPVKNLTPEQEAFVASLRSELAAEGLSLGQFLAGSHKMAIDALKVEIARVEAELAVQTGVVTEFHADLVNISAGRATGLAEGGLARTPGTRFNIGSQWGAHTRLNEAERRQGLLQTQLDQLRANLIELESITPEKALDAYLRGIGLSDAVVSAELARAEKVAQEQAAADHAAQIKADAEAKEAAQKLAIEQRDAETKRAADMAWVGEVVGTQKFIQRTFDRMDDSHREALIRLEGGIELGDPALIAQYMNLAWDGIQDLYVTANGKLGRHEEATAAVTYWLMSDAEKGYLDPNSPDFIRSVKATSLYQKVEKYTAPSGYAFMKAKSSMSPDELDALHELVSFQPVIPPRGRTHQPLRKIYFAVRPHFKTHAEAVAFMKEKLQVQNLRFSETMDAITINSTGARAGRAARSTLVAAGILLGSVGASSVGMDALNRAGIPESPTYSDQYQMIEPYVNPVLDTSADWLDSAGQFLDQYTPSAEEIGERFQNSRRIMP